MSLAFFYDAEELKLLVVLTFSPHYSSSLFKTNANAGSPDLVEPNFGQLDWL